MLRKFLINTALQRAQFCSDVKRKLRPEVHFEPSLTGELENKTIRPKEHPGRLDHKCIGVPTHYKEAIERCIGDHKLKTVRADASKLNNYLKSRHLPTEEHQMQARTRELREEVEKNLNVDASKLNEDELKVHQQRISSVVGRLLHKTTYAWKALEYDQYRSLVYLHARCAAEYAVLKRIFSEIRQRDPDFKPNSFFDFGAGVGTGTWVVSSEWKDSIYEYYLVDASKDMNDLSALILRDGIENKKMTLRNVYHRQFLPASNTLFDIVLSAYSLIEQPSRAKRLEVIANLWNKTDKYLVLVEMGTNAGFKMITEARDFLLGVNAKEAAGFLFAPCPHEHACPRELANDGTPCNFPVRYFPLELDGNEERRTELFSYVVFRKGVPPEYDPTRNWPRIVRETMIRTKHTHCDLCTKSGELRHIIFSKKKQGTPLYQCARASKWGDRLPISDITTQEVIVKFKKKEKIGEIRFSESEENKE